MAQDNMTNDIAASAQTAQKVANAAVAAGKAAAKAATGNLAGAAIEVVKNKELRNFIVGLLIVLIIVPMIAIMSFPAAIFSGIKDLFVKDEGEALQELQAQIESEVQAVITRFDIRKGQYEKMLNEIVEDIAKNTHVDKEYDFIYVEGVLNAPEITEDDAISYLCAYSIQVDNDPVKASEFSSLLEWIGSYGTLGTENADKYVVLGETYTTHDWTGNYMPQYLYEQEAQAKRYGWSIPEVKSDAFLEKVYYVSKWDGITVDYSYSVIPTIDYIWVPEDEAYKYLGEDTGVLPGEGGEQGSPAPSASPGPSPEPTASPSPEETEPPANDAPPTETEPPQEPKRVQVPVQVDKVLLNVVVTMTITKADTAIIPSRIMGFWDGDLSNYDPTTLLNRYELGVPSRYLSYCWTENGYTFTRQSGFQTSYYESLIATTKDYLNLVLDD